MKILLVEDDQQLGQALHSVLCVNGYAVTWVRSAEDGQRFIASEVFELLLLDVVLPGMSGLELLQWVREINCQSSVMMLTARDSISDRVAGLDGGADDYMPKPFAMEELLSRCRALLRRKGDQRSAVWTIGKLRINTSSRQVTLADAPINVSPREFDLLMRLAMTPGQVLTRTQLAIGSNAESSMESNAVDVHIYSLRKKLGADVIGTVRGVGYILEEP